MKRTPKLLLMILVLLVLVCLCLLVRSCDDDAPPAQQQIIYDASDIDGDSVSALTVTNENGTFAFKKQGAQFSEQVSCCAGKVELPCDADIQIIVAEVV